MMVRKTVALLCFLLLLSACSHAALAVDFTDDNYEVEVLNHCEIISLDTNRFDGSLPLIIFLPGAMECDNINHVACWIREYELYNDIDADVLSAAFWEEPAGNGSWRYMAEDLARWVAKKENAASIPVVIDAVSVSGFCGCYLAQLLRDRGVPVQEVNLAEACEKPFVTADLIADLAASGIRVNIWIGSDEAVWSTESREIAGQLEGTENVIATVLNVEKHGAELAAAIHDYGLHK